MTALALDIITTAAILFAVASGLLIILGVLKIVNFAHGGFLTIGGYSGLVVTQLGWNAWLAYPAAAVAGRAASDCRTSSGVWPPTTATRRTLTGPVSLHSSVSCKIRDDRMIGWVWCG